MLKKILNVFQYIILVILLISTANAIYLRSLQHIFGGIILVIFWATMILENKLSKKNKVVSITYYTTGTIILVINIIAILFGLNL